MFPLPDFPPPELLKPPPRLKEVAFESEVFCLDSRFKSPATNILTSEARILLEIILVSLPEFRLN